MADDGDMVVVGRVTALFGVRGAVKVHSLTDPPENLCDYRPWYMRSGAGWRERSPRSVKQHGRTFVAEFDQAADRDQAAALVGKDIAITRAQLPATGEDDHYWIDLVGLRVVTTEGTELGTVDHLLETGANDVLVVRGERERLIPYLPGQVVRAVRREAGLLEVDWDPEF